MALARPFLTTATLTASLVSIHGGSNDVACAGEVGDGVAGAKPLGANGHGLGLELGLALAAIASSGAARDDAGVHGALDGRNRVVVTTSEDMGIAAAGAVGVTAMDELIKLLDDGGKVEVGQVTGIVVVLVRLAGRLGLAALLLDLAGDDGAADREVDRGADLDLLEAVVGLVRVEELIIVVETDGGRAVVRARRRRVSVEKGLGVRHSHAHPLSPLGLPRGERLVLRATGLAIA